MILLPFIWIILPILMLHLISLVWEGKGWQMPDKIRSGGLLFPGSPLNVSHHQGAVEDRARREPMVRVILVHSGSARFLGKQTDEVVSTGCIITIPSAVSCQLFEGPDLRWTLLRFDPVKIGLKAWAIFQTVEFAAIFPSLAAKRVAGRQSPRILRLIPKHFDGTVALAGEIKREVSERLPGWRDLSISHFQHLLIHLSRQAGNQMKVFPDATRRMTGIIRHIESHYNKPLSMAGLARSCHLSERTFYRVFKNAIGQSPQAYIKRLRIQHAAEKLRDTASPITEIAFAAGFEDSNFFAREFRKATGSTPTEYRRHWQV